MVTSRAWTSIKRKDWKLLLGYNNFDIPNRLSFFGLPVEIRNQIYGYLFPARKVDIRKFKYEDSNFIPYTSPAWHVVLQARSSGRIKVFTNLNSGLALLSTCRRAYDECRLHYYRNSIFFLAPGEVADTIILAKVVQLANLELITSIGLHFDAADFNLKEYQSLVAIRGDTRVCGFHLPVAIGFFIIATRLLLAVWYRKLAWIYQKAWRSLRVIHLESSYSTMVIGLDEFHRRCSLADFARTQGYPRDPELKAYLMDVCQKVVLECLSKWGS